jgi:hypothetical protein
MPANSVAKLDGSGFFREQLFRDSSLPIFCRLINFLVAIPRGSHPFPSRTRKLSPAGPMILHG